MHAFRFNRFLSQAFLSTLLVLVPILGHADVLKPFVLGNAPLGDMAKAVAQTRLALTSNGFEVVGSYSPFAGATVICATHPELKAQAAKAANGAFGVAQRVAITEVSGKLQLSYVNPAYLGTAYGLGKLEKTSEALRTALGRTREFGSQGLEEERLKPGVYRYATGMPYFTHVDELAKHPDHATAVAVIEKNLAAGKGGTQKVYRIDLPQQDTSVFGIAIMTGDGLDRGAKDTDKEITSIIDFQELKHTAYLPYEIMVKGGEVIALRGRYRIALNFPDLKMFGKNGFSKIMSAPGGIKTALEAVANQ